MPSTVVAGIKYDPSRSVLRISFVSGLVYEYKAVPESVYLEMKKAGSKGEYLNEHIKGKYIFHEVERNSVKLQFEPSSRHYKCMINMLLFWFKYSLAA